MLIGYVRISKGEAQNNALQIQALKQPGVEKIFEEAASGGRWDRPILHKMLDHLRSGDTVVVWKLDRLSRSLKDLLIIMDKIDKAGAGFCSLTEAIDTTTAAGRMMMTMIGTFAEFERAMIRERTNAGLAAARAEGRIGGRRKKLSQAQRGTLSITSSPAGGQERKWQDFIKSASQLSLGSFRNTKLKLKIAPTNPKSFALFNPEQRSFTLINGYA